MVSLSTNILAGVYYQYYYTISKSQQNTKVAMHIKHSQNKCLLHCNCHILTLVDLDL